MITAEQELVDLKRRKRHTHKQKQKTSKKDTVDKEIERLIVLSSREINKLYNVSDTTTFNEKKKFKMTK